MPTAVTNSRDLKLRYRPEEAEARQILANLKAQISKPDGTTKWGVLALTHTRPRSAGDMIFERKYFFKFWSRTDARMNMTASYLKTLFKLAYGRSMRDTTRGLNFETIMTDFESYLETRKNRVGTRTLHQFLCRLENELPPVGNEQQEDLPENFERWKVNPSTDYSQNWQSTLRDTLVEKVFPEANNDPDIEEEADHLTGLLSSVLAREDGQDPQLTMLGSGAFGFACSYLGVNNQRHVLKVLSEPIDCPTGKAAGMRGREICAARLKDEPNIIRPTAYLVRFGVETFKVPSEKLKSFLRKLPEGTADVLGMIMPLAPGEPLARSGAKKSIYDLNDIKVVGREGIKSLISLARRNFIHRDIKPDNIIFDPGTKAVHIIDTGFLAKLSKNSRKPQASREMMGTPKFCHPSVMRRRVHGCEVDLFSLVFTMLDMHFPSAVSAIAKTRVISSTESKGGELHVPDEQKAWEAPGKGYLKNILLEAAEGLKPTSSAAAHVDDMWAALTDPVHEKAGPFLDFAVRALDISFGKKENYQSGLQSLLNHPFLQEQATIPARS